jgi:ABC-type taurine transport system substrate-binding protein
MENFKVRSLEGTEQKSAVQVEQELLDKHEQQFAEVKNQEPAVEVVEVSQNEIPPANDDSSYELSEEQVLSYIGKRYNKQINSLDELASQREQAEELPEDVAAYLKYKKETGRGINDFMQLNKDVDSMDPETLLKEYLASTQEGLDSEDIDVLMDDYRYDEDIDDELTIRKIKLETKKAVAEAKKFFNAQKEKYRVPLESRADSISEEQKEAYENYKRYIEQSKTIEEENERKRDWFNQKTEEVFSDDFKGFDFSIDDKKITFTPGDRAELKKNQATPLNFINKFLDEQGLIKDAVGYHKSLAVAMNPERFAAFFYEQGKADAVDGTMRNIKNIQMSERRAPEATRPTDGIQVKAVNPDSGRSLKIRSIKKM